MPQTICPRCGHNNPDAPLYCAKCGTDIEEASQLKAKSQVICPNCHSRVQADNFCSRCNANLSIPPKSKPTTPEPRIQSPGVWQKLTRNQKVAVACAGFILLIFIVTNFSRSDRNREGNTGTTRPTSSTPSKPLAPAPREATPRVYSTMVQNLAIIEGVQNNESKLSRISSLLAQLDAKFPEHEQQIGDMTAAASNEIKKKGQPASIIGIMEAMIIVSEAKSGISYADAVTAYALPRVKGMK
jgi:double zinc ribbon protein